MSRKKRSRKEKISNPKFYVFCEGESEEKYISFLKSFFRTKKIDIIYKKLGSKINQRRMNEELNKHTNLFIPNKDKIFILYDGDVISILEKLKSLKKTILLISTPCIELWFLLHFNEQNSFINKDICLKELKKIWKNYKKGELKNIEKEDLSNFMEKAKINAKKLELYKNPSSSIHLLLNEFSSKTK